MGKSKVLPLLLRGAALAAPIVAETIRSSQAPTNRKPKSKPRKRKGQRKKRSRGMGNLSVQSIGRGVAPVAQSITTGGMTIKFLNVNTSELTLYFRGFAASVQINATGTIATQTIGYGNIGWNSNLFGSNLGLANIPLDPTLINPTMDDLGQAFQKFKFHKIGLQYLPGCPTSTTGQFWLVPSGDPQSAINLTSNPSAINGLTSASAIPCTPWSPSEHRDITGVVDLTEKYNYDTSTSGINDLRLATAGCITIMGTALPAQTASTQYIGQVSLEFVVTFSQLTNSNVI